MIEYWCHGHCECFDCDYAWIGVWELGAESLHCPECESADTYREAVQE